eukprot:9906769-Karenia_brevis.AAC.1
MRVQLQEQLKEVRHQITLQKPADQRVNILEAAIQRYQKELETAMKDRDALNGKIADLKIDIQRAEGQLEVAQSAHEQKLIAESTSSGVLGTHIAALENASVGLTAEENFAFKILLAKVTSIITAKQVEMDKPPITPLRSTASGVAQARLDNAFAVANASSVQGS